MTRKGYFDIPQSLREIIKVTALAFLALALIGFVLGLLRPETITPLLDMFARMVEENDLAEIEGAELMAEILTNNLTALFLAMFLGMIPFLRLPAMELGLNALLLGAMASVYQREGISLAAYFAGTLPHGITELSALVIAIAAGLNLCRAVSDTLLRRAEKGAVLRAVADAMLLYARFVMPLLLVSAFIEAFVTPSLMARFL